MDLGHQPTVAATAPPAGAGDGLGPTRHPPGALQAATSTPAPEPQAERVLFKSRDLPPLGADARAGGAAYELLLAAQEERRRARARRRTPGRDGREADPAGSVRLAVLVALVGPVDPARLSACLGAILGQSEPGILALAMTDPSPAALEAVVDAAVAPLAQGPRAAWRALRARVEAGTDLAGALQAAARLLDPGADQGAGARLAPDGGVLVVGAEDLVAPEALFALAEALGEADAAYGDEDLLADRPALETEPAAHAGARRALALRRAPRSAAAEVPSGAPATFAPPGVHGSHGSQGATGQPLLKPAFSPDLLLTGPYMGRPFAVRADVLAAAGGIRPLCDGDWEHDLMLRVAETTRRIRHLPEVLYHRRSGQASASESTSGPPGAGPGAVIRALARRGEAAQVDRGPAGTWHVRRSPPAGPEGAPPRASVIVPFRDQPAFLRRCVDAVLAPGGTVAPELVLVDNGSTEPETATLLETLATRTGVVIWSDPRPFNWAALNNAAAEQATGEVLVFLNNDIDARRPGWLDLLVAQALRGDVGAVGARLLYPSRRVQHAGVVLGLGGAAGHVLVGLPEESPGYLAMAVRTRECSAVTGACLATRRDVFDELGGFDESLGVDLNDIDFCLRAGLRGYRVLYEPAAELVHYESPSRGTAGSMANIARFVDRWEDLIHAGDPFLNPHLTRRDASCALADPDEEEWWQTWRASLDPR